MKQNDNPEKIKTKINTQSRSQRLKWIEEVLKVHSNPDTPLTLKQIIEYLDLKKLGHTITRDTIRRDIEELRNRGNLIEEDTVNNKSIFWYESGIFDLDELRILIDSISSSKSLRTATAKRIIKKLRTFANENDGRTLVNDLYVDHQRRTTNNKMSRWINQLHQAIHSSSYISLTYSKFALENNHLIIKQHVPVELEPYCLMTQRYLHK